MTGGGLHRVCWVFPGIRRGRPNLRTDEGRRVMKSIDKRRLLATGALLLLGFVAAVPSVRAQEYPSQDIRLVVGFPPGSGADVLVRFFAEKLRPIAGRTVIV